MAKDEAVIESTEQSFGDDAMLDENTARLSRSRSRRKYLIIGIALLAVAAIVVAVVVVTKGGATKASNAKGHVSNSTSSGSADSSPTTTGPLTTTDSSGNTKKYSDPTSEKFPMVAFAIGDWGATTYSKNGSCCDRRKGIFNAFDLHAEQGVNQLMAIEAANTKPQVVISHGDNFYWTGINGKKDQATRFAYTFEERHNDPSMNTVPWVNVMGNHDYGGGDYICMDSDENIAACSSADELTAALKAKFSFQADYKSPNNDRWILKDHYYKYTIKQGDISMDIFNIDNNDADVHGANEICCQCYSYTNGNDKKCETSTRGQDSCCKGDTALYDACVKQFDDWGDDSLTQLQKDVAASKATWKVVNAHYSPFDHNGETKGTKWLKAMKNMSGIQLFIYGHTHGEKHDWASFNTHFIENGAGGGIQSESASGIPDYAKDSFTNIWTAPGLGEPDSDGGSTYGFFKLEASKDWMKASYVTFGDGWSLTKTDPDLSKSSIGKSKIGYCWYIPSDGAKGEKCST